MTSPDDVRPFRLTMTVRNNRMVRAREALGFASAKAFAEATGLDYGRYAALEAMSASPLRMYRPLSGVCVRVDCTARAHANSPWCRTHGAIARGSTGETDPGAAADVKPTARLEWSKLAQDVALRLGVDEEWLWPAECRQVVRSRVHVECTASDLRLLSGVDDGEWRPELSADIRAALDALPGKHELMLRLRHGFDGRPLSLSEAGEVIDVSRERARQIELKAEQEVRLLLHRGPGHGPTGRKPLRAVVKAVAPKRVRGGLRRTTRVVLECGHTENTGNPVSAGVSLWPCSQCERIPETEP